jgi:hypothetical protein
MTTKPLDLSQFEGHTPGPWETATNPDHKEAVIYAGLRGIASVWAIPNSQDYKANALLIAAAPALLAECKRQREQIKVLSAHLASLIDAYTVTDGKAGASPTERVLVREQARAALAKVPNGGMT